MLGVYLPDSEFCTSENLDVAYSRSLSCKRQQGGGGGEGACKMFTELNDKHLKIMQQIACCVLNVIYFNLHIK